jgi:hypothetical protein
MSAHPGQFTAQDSSVSKNGDRPRFTKPLPTDRVSPQNQLNILRAWASVSHDGTRAATVNEVALMVGMASSTVAMTNPFFSSIGLLQRLAIGTYVPSPDVIAFFNSNDATSAARKLAPAFRDAWFGKLLIPKLKYAAMLEKEVLSTLADEAGVGTEQQKALEFLLEFMAVVELIVRDEFGGKVRLAPRYLTPSQFVPTVTVDGSSYCVSVRVDSKSMAESLVNLLTSLAALAAKKGVV